MVVTRSASQGGQRTQISQENGENAIRRQSKSENLPPEEEGEGQGGVGTFRANRRGTAGQVMPGGSCRRLREGPQVDLKKGVGHRPDRTGSPTGRAGGFQSTDRAERRTTRRNRLLDVFRRRAPGVPRGQGNARGMDATGPFDEHHAPSHATLGGAGDTKFAMCMPILFLATWNCGGWIPQLGRSSHEQIHTQNSTFCVRVPKQVLVFEYSFKYLFSRPPILLVPRPSGWNSEWPK